MELIKACTRFPLINVDCLLEGSIAQARGSTLIVPSQTRNLAMASSAILFSGCGMVDPWDAMAPDGPAKDIDNSLNGYKQEENTKQIVRSLARGQCRYAPAAVHHVL
jgi:hypothetical protein